MSYRVRVNLEGLRARMESIRAVVQPTTEDMTYLGNAALNRIYLRTAVEGKDRYGNSLEPYSTKPIYIGPSSEAYSLAKSAGGRTEYLSGTRGRMTRVGRRGGTSQTYAYRPAKLSGKRRRANPAQDPFLQGGSFGGRNSRKMLSVAFAGGWAEFKSKAAIAGAAARGLVNLVLTGKMMGSGAVFSEGSGDAAFEIVGVSPGKVSLGFTRADREQVAQGLVERGRDFWGFGDMPEEIEMAQKLLIEDRVLPRLRDALGGAA